jgi:8-oxo-dGTP pyrophosphatase MutT (NUDIX family)
MNAPPPAPAVPSATLVLLRDGARGLEALMMARHEKSGFAAGALVFPGGKIDAADHGLAAGRPGGDGWAAARFAAIRETWEECGVLLARRPGHHDAAAGGLLGRAEVEALLRTHGRALPGLLGAPDIELAAEGLVPFAHWITPVIRPKRFDTLFFLAAFAGDQEPRHDGREAVAVRWVRPAQAIEEADAGLIKLVFVTRMNLLKLSRSPDAAAALAAARQGSIVTVTPELVKTEAGAVMRIPAEADYGVTDVPMAQVQAG